MKYLRIIALIFSTILIGTSIAPADQKGPEPIEAGKSLSGKFIQKRYLSGFDAPLETSGEFFLVPTQGLAWKVNKPFVSRLLMTDDGVTQIIHGSAVKVEGAAGLAKIVTGMMYPALAGDWQSLEKDFKVTVTQSDPSAKEWHASLHPLSDLMRKIITKIDVGGAETTRALTIHKSNGDRDEIEFSDQRIMDQPSVAARKAFVIEGAQ